MDISEYDLILQLILQIENAEEPASVTNAMVARVLDFLRLGVETAAKEIGVEAESRQAADEALRGNLSEVSSRLFGIETAVVDCQKEIDQVAAELRGLPVLRYDGILPEEAQPLSSAPAAAAMVSAAASDGLRVYYDRNGRFILGLTSNGRSSYHDKWGGLAQLLHPSEAYVHGALLVTPGGQRRFYTWSGKGEPRPLGSLGAVGEALAGSGALIPGVRVEHKGSSARIVIASVDPDGSAGEVSASIGAVGNKAGLMLPEHAQAITDLGRRLDLLESSGGGSPGGECGCSAITEEEIGALFGDAVPEGPADAERITTEQLDDLIDDGVAQIPVVSPPGEDRLDEKEIDALIGSIF